MVEERLLEGERSGDDIAAFFSLTVSYPFRGERASAGVGGAYRGLRHDGGQPGHSKEKKKEWKGHWKSGGGRTHLYT